MPDPSLARARRRTSALSQGAQFDPTKAKAFARRPLTAVNNDALCLMVSVAYRAGLVDVVRDLPPSTSEEIVRKAHMNETARVVGVV